MKLIAWLWIEKPAHPMVKFRSIIFVINAISNFDIILQPFVSSIIPAVIPFKMFSSIDRIQESSPMIKLNKDDEITISIITE